MLYKVKPDDIFGRYLEWIYVRQGGQCPIRETKINIQSALVAGVERLSAGRG